VNLAGEPVSQRWTKKVRERIRSSREQGDQSISGGVGGFDESSGGAGETRLL